MRGAKIVRELMMYSGQDKADLSEPVDVSRLVKDMLLILKVSVPKRTVLQTALPQNLPAVLGNAPKIRQVVMSLVINASEAIGEKHGVITVSTSLVTLRKGLFMNRAMNLPDGNLLAAGGLRHRLRYERRDKEQDVRSFFHDENSRAAALGWSPCRALFVVMLARSTSLARWAREQHFRSFSLVSSQFESSGQEALLQV